MFNFISSFPISILELKKCIWNQGKEFFNEILDKVQTLDTTQIKLSFKDSLELSIFLPCDESDSCTLIR